MNDEQIAKQAREAEARMDKQGRFEEARAARALAENREALVEARGRGKTS